MHENWGQCANLDKMTLQPLASQASLRNRRISGGSLALAFARSNRRSCWLTFAALRIVSFCAIHSCETVVRFQSSSARASFCGADPFMRGKSFAPSPATRKNHRPIHHSISILSSRSTRHGPPSVSGTPPPTPNLSWNAKRLACPTLRSQGGVAPEGGRV